MSAAALAQTILTFVGVVGVGWLLRATGVLRKEDARPLNTLIIYVGLPAFIINAVRGATLDMKLAIVVVVAWLVFGVMVLLGWVGARALKLPTTASGAFILITSLGNTGYLGYPIAQAVLGERALSQAIFYDVFGTVGGLLFVGLAIAEHYSGSNERRKHPLREVIGFPAVIALAVGLGLRWVSVPKVVNSGLDLLASLVVPMILISVGLSLDPGVVRLRAVPLTAAAVLKLLVAPLIAMALISLMGGGSVEQARLVVLQASMPTMMLTLVIGARFELDNDLIASAIFVTTALSALSIPLMQLMVG